MSQLTEFGLGEKLKVKGKIQAVGIVGCGSVGQGITLLVARYGMEVVFVDISKERIDEIFNSLESQLDDEINHWGITPSEKRLVLSRILGTTNFKKLSHCDIVIEAISSRKKGTEIEPRRNIFRKIEEVVSGDTIISSNVSTLMISDLAEVLKKPGRAIGIHFIEPIDKTNIVEVVNGVQSTAEAHEKVMRFCGMINKKGVCVHESPGNISTRMIIPIINEACEMLMEGVASVQDIDLTMRETLGNNVGPFELADKIGLDKVLKYMDNLYTEYGDNKYKASPVIKRLVRANYFGRYVGRGFYNYENEKPISSTITYAIIK
ncbi:MAG: 3-hydroxyacyl-CoA dehydrogenase family protein [Bacteroidetes bacterium]|nr:3-hydroxyacyl-CoA dehydrogenase family protein [Bacteroidota bacterium]MBL6944164.1 3-hydroxyacyl-CoA dehydrogenase family protein [Bacteroidales bacterium]